MAPDPPKRKRGRPSNASKLLEAQSGVAPRPAQPRRPRKSDADAKTKRKRTQSSLRESWGSTTGRRVTAGEDDNEDEDDNHNDTRPGKRARVSDASRRTSQGAGTSAGVIGRRGIPQPNQPGALNTSEASRRRAAAPVNDNDADDADDGTSNRPALQSPSKPYVHVAPHTRRVRQSAIESKWTPLANASLTAVSSTLQYAQRPILQRLADSQLRRAHTSSALRQITHRISRKITRGLPFPPASMPANVGRAPLQSDAGREVELNFESVLDGKLSLERQLEPALDGLEVLRREKEAMEEELALDYETLRNLEAGARAQAREQRSLLKKAHLLTPAVSGKREGSGEPYRDGEREGEGDGFVFGRDEAMAKGGAFANIHHEDDLHPLAVQLGEHVDGIRDNLEQTEGVLPLVARSKAALRAVLLKYLDQRAYEHAVLG